MGKRLKFENFLDELNFFYLGLQRIEWRHSSVLLKIHFCSVSQSCPTLCDLMNCSTPGLPVHHQLPEFTQTHIHWVSDAIQPSHPVVSFSSYPQSPPASECFPMSQLFAWGGQSTGVSALASFPPKNTQDWSTLEWTGWISLQSKGLSRVFSNTTIQKHQFFCTQPSLWSNSHMTIGKTMSVISVLCGSKNTARYVPQIKIHKHKIIA